MACTLAQDPIDGTISFHGHWCPGLASGIRAAELMIAGHQGFFRF